MGTSRRSSSLVVEGHTPAPNEQPDNGEVVTADYFETVGLAIVEGRGFTADDDRAGQPQHDHQPVDGAAVLPQGAPSASAGRTEGPIGDDSRVIIGVVEDAKYMDVRGATPNMVYGLSAACPARCSAISRSGRL